MKDRGHTQKSLGAIVGVAQSAVFNWLHGTLPGSGELYRISLALEKPIAWFLEEFDVKPVSIDDLKTPVNDISADKLKALIKRMGFDSVDAYAKWLDDCHTSGFSERLGAAFALLGKNARNEQLTNKAETLTNAAVQPVLPKLIQRLKRVTSERGQKTKLAAWLGVHRQCVTDWLSGKQEPGGEITLRLLKWVEQQERQ